MNVERKAPQVLDLSKSTRSEPLLEITASEASEVVLSLFLLTGDCDWDTYDELSSARMEEINAAIPPPLKKDLDELIAGSEVMAQLVGLVAEAEARDVPALIAHLEELPALEILLGLIGYYQQPHPNAPPELIRAAATGQNAAAQELAAIATEHYPDWLPELENLLKLGPERVKELLLVIIPAWAEQVWPLFEVNLEALETDAESKREMASKMSLEKLIETASNGFQYTSDKRTRRIVMFPSIVLRPWLVHLDHKDLQVLCYPVADSPGEGGTMTGAQLARFYKALGDEGRLKLLKRLAEGPLSLPDAAKEIGVAKSTAHHHLGLLRHAGLVLIRERGSEKTWTLRRDLLPQAGEILNSFLGSS
jgi:DNA-binding transcriptional ArsR family regulator